MSAPNQDNQDIPGRCNCAQGVKCINAIAGHDLQMQAWLRANASQPGSAGQKPRLKRGHQFKTASAVKNYVGGWLPCHHFCCDFLTEVAKAYCDTHGLPKQTCVDSHVAVPCTEKGDKDLEVYRAALAQTSAAQKVRMPVGLTKVSPRSHLGLT
jgi:hypothetical protein